MTFRLLYDNFKQKANSVGFKNDERVAKFSYMLFYRFTKDQTCDDFGAEFNGDKTQPLVTEKDWEVISRTLPGDNDLKKTNYFKLIEGAEKSIENSVKKMLQNNKVNVPLEKDEQFNEVFVKWTKEDPDRLKIETVLNSVKSMNKTCTDLRKQFNDIWNNVDKLKEGIKTNKDKARPICGDTTKILKNAKKLVEYLGSVRAKEVSYNEQLSKMIKLQEELNSKRKEWAELAIGKRTTLDSDRKSKPAKGSSSSSSNKRK